MKNAHTIIYGLLLTTVTISAHAGMTIVNEPDQTEQGLKNAIVPIKPLPTWTLTAGDAHRKDLEAWADKAGWKVIWNLSKDWIIPASTVFTGSFETATGDVIKTLAANGALIHAQFYEGNKTVVITGASE